MFELLYGLAIALGINILMFIPAYLFKTDKLTDASYGLSFLFIVLFIYFQELSLEKLIIVALVAIWAIRLVTYLFIRIRKMKRDKRFDGIRENFIKFGGFWLLQGISVWIILIPTILALTNETFETTLLTYIGALISLTGIVLESTADFQKYTFINNEASKGKWIASGVWKYSRHPNYFGEILMWVGVYFTALSSFTTVQAFTSIISPLYILFILVYVTGLPKLEKEADQRWGDNPDYQTYKRKTSVLIPLPRKK